MVQKSKGILRIGTSGIVVPGSKQNFPIEFRLKSRLNYYSFLFNTLEVNSTFKKIPMLSTFEKWTGEVTDKFEFTLKLWGEITHIKELQFDSAKIATFVQAAAAIGNKKGCLLVQFPGSITVKYIKQVEQILKRLHELDTEKQWRKAVEFRSVSWYESATFEMLNRYKGSIVLHDMPKSKNTVSNAEAEFAYYRFHGPKGDYRGSYNDDFLKEQAKSISERLSHGNDVYAYFNNTMGNAYDNAMSLKGMIEKDK